MTTCDCCSGKGWYRKDSKVFRCHCLFKQDFLTLIRKFPTGTIPKKEGHEQFSNTKLLVVLGMDLVGSLVYHLLSKQPALSDISYVSASDVVKTYFLDGVTYDDMFAGASAPFVVVDFGIGDVSHRLTGSVMAGFLRHRQLDNKYTYLLLRKPFRWIQGIYGPDLVEFLRTETTILGALAGSVASHFSSAGVGTGGTPSNSEDSFDGDDDSLGGKNVRTAPRKLGGK